jgi:hypothetical protein
VAAWLPRVSAPACEEIDEGALRPEPASGPSRSRPYLSLSLKINLSIGKIETYLSDGELGAVAWAFSSSPIFPDWRGSEPGSEQFSFRRRRSVL